MAIIPANNQEALIQEVNGKLDWDNLSPEFKVQLEELIKKIAEETP